jgi:protein-S-isoprenylcysteine O-methyltransferase Ste14
MSNETPFQLALGMLVVTLMPVAAYHRLRAAQSKEPISRRGEGLFFCVALRLCGVTAWLCLLAYLMNPRSMAWATVPLPSGLRWAGLALCAGAMPWLTWMFVNLGRNITDTVVTRRAHTFVASGPYRWVRSSASD